MTNGSYKLAIGFAVVLIFMLTVQAVLPASETESVSYLINSGELSTTITVKFCGPSPSGKTIYGYIVSAQSISYTTIEGGAMVLTMSK